MVVVIIINIKYTINLIQIYYETFDSNDSRVLPKQFSFFVKGSRGWSVA